MESVRLYRLGIVFNVCNKRPLCQWPFVRSVASAEHCVPVPVTIGKLRVGVAGVAMGDVIQEIEEDGSF